MAEDQAPKIHVDDDWKAQARAEKERLASKPADAAKPTTPGAPGASAGAGAKAGSAPGAGGLPPANFQTLVSTMATQALFAMGAIADPRTGQRHQSLDLARHHIDMLTVIEEKTKGNLTPEEADMIAQTVYELRTNYIRLASAARGV